MSDDPGHAPDDADAGADADALAGVDPTADPALDAGPDGVGGAEDAAGRDQEHGNDGPGEIRVIGTAHVSQESVDEVERAIDEERPDVVAVELDEGRFRQLRGETPDDVEASDLLSGSTAFQFLAYWMLSYVQTRLGERFDIQPGAEMKAAVEAAGRSGAGVALIDRDIQVTVQRFWARMRLREKVALVWQLALAMLGFGGDPEDEEFDVEQLTDTDVVSAMMEEFRRFSPGGAEALIDERDAYLAHNLLALRESGYDVVAVIGAGHREGVERYLANPETLPPMEELVGRQSRRLPLGRIVGAGVAVVFLAFFFLLAMAGIDDAVLLRVVAAWFLFNGTFAFGLALLAGAHWSSALVGGLVAWLTSLNPLLAPGWFAGYVELRRRPVNVADVSRLNELLSDQETPLGELVGQMRRVPLFRLILVVALTNVGSIIATFLFPFVVLPFFGPPFDSVDAVLGAMQRGMENSAAEIAELVGLLGGTLG